MDDLAKLKNIGEKTAIWLHEIDVHSAEDIETLGVVEVYRRLKAERPEVSLVALWALQGAMMNISFTQIPPEIKHSLLQMLEEDHE